MRNEAGSCGFEPYTGEPLVDLPSISVITPCMNSAATLQETLDSVRGQAYPQLEHIVVDGGSTDGTLELLHAADDGRWVSEPDEGRVDAANKGLRMATGDVVAWLNADDRYEPGALLSVVADPTQNNNTEQ